MACQESESYSDKLKLGRVLKKGISNMSLLNVLEFFSSIMMQVFIS